MALLLAKALIDADQLSLEAVVCTLHPAKRRAQLVRGTLDALGLSEVPVIVGSDGGDAQKQQTAPRRPTTSTFPETTMKELNH